MVEPTSLDPYAQRLRQVAIEVAHPTGPGLDQGILLAEEMVAAGIESPSVLEVAALVRGASRSDAEPAVRAMLASCGVRVPDHADESGRYRILLEAFAFGELPYDQFEGPFYARLLAVDRQDKLDREIVFLMDMRDQVSGVADRAEIAEEIRAVVRAHLDAS